MCGPRRPCPGLLGGRPCVHLVRVLAAVTGVVAFADTIFAYVPKFARTIVVEMLWRMNSVLEIVCAAATLSTRRVFVVPFLLFVVLAVDVAVVFLRTIVIVVARLAAHL